MDAKKPGRTRQKLAELLQTSFPSLNGLPLTWKPENLYPATGAFRTNPDLDCCRWEGFGVRIREDGSEVTLMDVYSYERMSDLIKATKLKRMPLSGEIVVDD